MADKQDESERNPKQIPDSVSDEIDSTDVTYYVELGHTSGPPRARTKDAAPKQWQPPKNQSTPSNRAQST